MGKALEYNKKGKKGREKGRKERPKQRIEKEGIKE